MELGPESLRLHKWSKHPKLRYFLKWNTFLRGVVCFNIKKWGPRCVRSLPVAVVAVLVVPVSWVSHGGLEHTWRQKHSAFSLHAGLTNHRSAVYTCVQSHLSESSGSSCGSCVGGSRLVGLTRWIWAGVTDRKWRNRSRLLSWGLVGAHLRRGGAEGQHPVSNHTPVSWRSSWQSERQICRLSSLQQNAARWHETTKPDVYLQLISLTVMFGFNCTHSHVSFLNSCQKYFKEMFFV